jgi:hypothetical protein
VVAGPPHTAPCQLGVPAELVPGKTAVYIVPHSVDEHRKGTAHPSAAADPLRSCVKMQWRPSNETLAVSPCPASPQTWYGEQESSIVAGHHMEQP